MKKIYDVFFADCDTEGGIYRYDMLEDGRLAIEEMKRLDLSIEDAAISADIARLEQVSARIFKEVKADPKKGKQIRKFMDYYLPTTLKLLNAYADLDSQPVQGETILASKREIEGTLDTLNLAYEKLKQQYTISMECCLD